MSTMPSNSPLNAPTLLNFRLSIVTALLFFFLIGALLLLWAHNFLSPVAILAFPVALLVGFFIVMHPEYALVLVFSSAIIKEWASSTIPVFAQFDFTIGLFLLAVFSSLFWSLREGTFFTLKIDSSFYTLLFFTCWLLITTFYTKDSSYGLFKSFSFLLFNWTLFVLPVMVLNSISIARRMINIFVLLGVAASIFTIVTMIKGVMGGTLFESYRASFLGINPISFAGWVGTINIMLIVILPDLKSKLLKVASFASIGVLGVAMLIANSRGPLLAFVVTFFMVGVIRFKLIPKWKIIVVVISLIVLLIALFMVLPEEFTNRYAETLGGKSSGNYMAMYTVNSRLLFWKTSLQISTENVRQFLFGVGVGGFNTYFVHIKELTLYPHNLFFEVLCELGVVGLALIVIFFLQIFLRATALLYRVIPDNLRYVLLAFFMAALFQLIASQFSGDLNDNRRLWFFLGSTIAMINIYNSKIQRING